ncbi:MAG: hypothetical protein DRQ46_00195 [Gammaproteobacteria bacterium]|nr:MAG: hypothetical protein DRQ46_00195 [Gammaproteobacteria bacterium]
MAFKRIEKIKRRPRAIDYNKIVESVNQLNNMKTGPGLQMVNTPDGAMLNPAQIDSMFVEPNHRIEISNSVDIPLNEILPANSAIGIVESFDTDFVRIQGSRTMVGRRALPRDFGNIGITTDNLVANEVGFAYIDGFALINIVRWFKTSFSEIDIYHDPDYDPESGEDKHNTVYCIPNPHGLLSIIWEEDPYAPLEEWDETPHRAIVKFNNKKPGLQYANQTPEAIGVGCALIPDNGYDDDGYFKLKQSDVDAPPVVYVNLGGESVNYLDIGCAAPTDRMFMGRVNLAVSSGSTVGVRNSQLEFSHVGSEFDVIEYLGENEAGDKYALLMKSSGGGGDWEKFDT